jgi:hypothetical protein
MLTMIADLVLSTDSNRILTASIMGAVFLRAKNASRPGGGKDVGRSWRDFGGSNAGYPEDHL